eukprot:m.815773 g.815773  ORF g.815773 m.815773 type:complete len:315 (-) comp59377_c0_seq2:208-1152(-)
MKQPLHTSPTSSAKSLESTLKGMLKLPHWGSQHNPADDADHRSLYSHRTLHELSRPLEYDRAALDSASSSAASFGQRRTHVDQCALPQEQASVFAQWMRQSDVASTTTVTSADLFSRELGANSVAPESFPLRHPNDAARRHRGHPADSARESSASSSVQSYAAQSPSVSTSSARNSLVRETSAPIRTAQPSLSPASTSLQPAHMPRSALPHRDSRTHPNSPVLSRKASLRSVFAASEKALADLRSNHLSPASSVSSLNSEAPTQSAHLSPLRDAVPLAVSAPVSTSALAKTTSVEPPVFKLEQLDLGETWTLEL